jgi:hypothetical protein
MTVLVTRTGDGTTREETERRTRRGTGIETGTETEEENVSVAAMDAMDAIAIGIADKGIGLRTTATTDKKKIDVIRSMMERTQLKFLVKTTIFTWLKITRMSQTKLE